MASLFLSGHLYLVNQHFGTLTFELAHPVSVAGPTLRRSRTIERTVSLERGRWWDITTELGLTKEAAEQVIAVSPAAQRLLSFGWLRVLDPDHRVEPSPVPIPAPAAPVSLNVDGSVEPTGAATAPNVDGSGAAEASTGATAAPADAVVSSTSTAPPTVEQLIASVADSAPSTKWTLERLRAYAEARGIKVDPAMSKNGVLRRIRTAGK